MNSLSIASNHATHPSPHCPRVLVIQRRLGVSPSVARAYAEHAFGDDQRSDLAHLAAVTADRVSSSTGARL